MVFVPEGLGSTGRIPTPEGKGVHEVFIPAGLDSTANGIRIPLGDYRC